MNCEERLNSIETSFVAELYVTKSSAFNKINSLFKDTG